MRALSNNKIHSKILLTGLIIALLNISSVFAKDNCFKITDKIKAHNTNHNCCPEDHSGQHHKGKKKSCECQISEPIAINNFKSSILKINIDNLLSLKMLTFFSFFKNSSINYIYKDNNAQIPKSPPIYITNCSFLI